MRNFSLTCLGVGDGWPCADRNHASFLYRFGRTTLLVDCGEPVDRTFRAAGASPDLIDGIVVSHLHADHIGGFFMLMQGFWVEGRRRDLPVYMPGGAIRPLRDMLRTTLIFDELLNFRLHLLPLKIRQPISFRDVQVTAFPTSHLDGLRAKFQKRYHSDFSAHSFLFQAGGRRIGHSADLGRPEDLEPLLQKPLDLLVCEMSHFAAEELLVYLRGRRIRRIVFMHLGRTYWEDLPRTRRMAAKMLPDIPHSFAHDGTVIGI